MPGNYLFYCAQQSHPFSLIIKANFRIVTAHIVMCGGRGRERERKRERKRGREIEGGREGEKERRGERGAERERASNGGIRQRDLGKEEALLYKNPLYLP